MIKNDLFPHVFQPLTIRGVTLKNRLQYAPTVVLKCTPEGDVTQEMLDYVAWQADTGVSYLTIGNTPVVYSDSSAWTCELDVTSDRCIHGIEQMVRTARNHGAEMSIELAHAGRGSSHDPKVPALAPSDVPLNGGPLGYIKPMNRDDMDYIRNQFVDCAIRCKNAGLRIIMIHCAHNNLLAQFLSPASNQRNDEYGGSLENRMRFPLEVLAAVRAAVPDMVIECRVSAQEDTLDGLQLEDSLQFMEKAQEFVDIMHISRGNIFFNYGSTYTIPTYFKGRLLNVEFASQAKQRLHIPVAVVGNITSLAEAEEILAQGRADIIVMAKAYMADGDIIHKSVRGKAHEVRPCTRCDWCGNANNFGTSMRCAVNPMLGRRIELDKLTENKKRVLVIGGGPAGMTAARTCSAMGHDVILCEKTDSLGGMLKVATAAPFKNYMKSYLNWAIDATEKCGAKIIYNTVPSLETVETLNPDAIIVSTGSEFICPQIEGMDHHKIVRVDDVELDRVKIGEKIAVCGGGIVGMECALMLAMKGKDVTIIDQLETNDWAKEMPVFNHIELDYQLNKYKVKRIGGESILSFNDDGIHLSSGAICQADNYVIALGVKPNREFADQLLAKYPEGVYVVGDCVSSGRVLGDANNEAFAAAISIR